MVHFITLYILQTHTRSDHADSFICFNLSSHSSWLTTYTRTIHPHLQATISIRSVCSSFHSYPRIGTDSNVVVSHSRPDRENMSRPCDMLIGKCRCVVASVKGVDGKTITIAIIARIITGEYTINQHIHTLSKRIVLCTLRMLALEAVRSPARNHQRTSVNAISPHIARRIHS